MTWTRATTRSGLPIMEQHSSGGHIVAIRLADGWGFDAWGSGRREVLPARSVAVEGITHAFKPATRALVALGHFGTAAEARAAVEGRSG